MKLIVVIVTFFHHLTLSNAFVVDSTKARTSTVVPPQSSGISPCDKLPQNYIRAQSFMEMKKKKVNAEDEKNESSSWLERVKSKPGTIIILPFVAIFFLDIVANILVVTKRTIEYALTGQYTVWHF